MVIALYISTKCDGTKIPPTPENVADKILTGEVECKMTQTIFSKQVLPREVILDGSSNFHIFTPEKASCPIEITPSGMETEVSARQFWKHPSGIEVTPTGMTI